MFVRFRPQSFFSVSGLVQVNYFRFVMFQIPRGFRLLLVRFGKPFLQKKRHNIVLEIQFKNKLLHIKLFPSKLKTKLLLKIYLWGIVFINALKQTLFFFYFRFWFRFRLKYIGFVSDLESFEFGFVLPDPYIARMQITIRLRTLQKGGYREFTM